VLKSLGASAAAAPVLLADAFICVYRMRYRNDAAHAVDTAADACGLDLRRHVLGVWCAAVPKCLKQHDFYRAVLGAVTRMITALAAQVGIHADDVIQAPQAAAARIIREAAEVTERGFDRGTPFDQQNLKFVLDLTTTAIAGIAAGLWAADVEPFVGRIVDFTAAVIAKAGVDDAKKDVVAAEAVFLKQLATLLDGRRWDDVYQFIFCVWGRRTAEA
jgi:hypothetical protein